MYRSTRRFLPLVTRRPRFVPPLQSRYQHRIPGTRSAHSETATGGKGSETSGRSERQGTHHKRTPDTSEPQSFSEEFEHRIPSNQARPTLSDEYQHSGVDSKHPERPPREERDPNEVAHEEEGKEDVRKHNDEVENRYDRAYSQLTQEGEVDTLEEKMKAEREERAKEE